MMNFRLQKYKKIPYLNFRVKKKFYFNISNCLREDTI